MIFFTTVSFDNNYFVDKSFTTPAELGLTELRLTELGLCHPPLIYILDVVLISRV